MPLVVGAGGVVVAPPPKPVFVDIPTATLTDPYGVEWPLNDRSLGYWTPAGVAGINSLAPLTITSDPLDSGGEDIRYVYAGPRLITWPLFVEGSTHTEFMSRWRALAKAFASTSRRGPATLRIARPDGTVRQIQVYYSDGFEGDQSLPGMRADLAVLTLRCPDPYWQGVNPVEIVRAESSGDSSSFFSPFMTLAGSQVLGATVVTNPGDVPAYPVWQVTGPLSSFTATNLDTGEEWVLDVVSFRGSELAAGETVTITTRPMTIIGPDGSDWTGALTLPTSVLWSLSDGDVNVSFAAAGSSTGTQIAGTFVPRYETA